MTKRESRTLAMKYYVRNLKQRCAIDHAPIEERVRLQHRLYLLVRRLHQVFDTIECEFGKEWTNELYKQSFDAANRIACSNNDSPL